MNQSGTEQEKAKANGEEAPQARLQNYAFLRNVAAFASNTVSIMANFVLHMYVNFLILEVMVVFKIRRYIDSYYKSIIYFHLYVLELGMVVNLLILNWLYAFTGTNPCIDDTGHEASYNSNGWLKVSSIHSAYWRNFDIEFKKRYSIKKGNGFLSPLTLFVEICYPQSNSEEQAKADDQFNEVLCTSVRPIIEDRMFHMVEAMGVDPPPSVVYGPLQAIIDGGEEQQPPPLELPLAPLQQPQESPKHHFSLHHRRPKKPNTMANTMAHDTTSTFTVDSNYSQDAKSTMGLNDDDTSTYKKVSSFFRPPPLK